MALERKIIVESMVGSKLYGTNHPKSDDDFYGVFIHSAQDLFGIEKRADHWTCNIKLSEGPKNTLGDTDRNFCSLPSFLFKAATGDSHNIEILFTPKEMCKVWTPEWEKVLSYRKYIISQNIKAPFLDFSKAQAHKAANKIENLTLLKEFHEFFSQQESKHRIKDVMPDYLVNQVETVVLGGREPAFILSGRTFLYSLKLSHFKKNLEELVSKYGSRAHNAVANGGYDWKSLAHAYRLVFEAESLLQYGELIFPLPPDQINFLKTILRGEYKPEVDFFDDLHNRQELIRNMPSELPEKANHSKLEELCQEMMYSHFKKNL